MTYSTGGPSSQGSTLEVHADLLTDQRQDEQHAHQDEQAVVFQPGQRQGKPPWQQAHRHPSAIQRRQRDHVEHRQDDVDLHRDHKALLNPKQAVSGRKSIQRSAQAAKNARTMLIAGPASATSTMP